jgi:AcrR family transcriptional regulator
MQEHILQPKQERGLKRQEAVIQAGLRLLQTETLESLTMTQLAKEANCSVGNIYKRFSGKEGFLAVLIAAVTEDLLKVTKSRLALATERAETLHDAIHEVVALYVMTSREYGGLIRAIRLYRLKHYPKPTPNLTGFRREISGLEIDLFRKFLPKELDFEAHRREIVFCVETVFTNIVQVAMLPVATVTIDDDDIVELSVNLLEASLNSVVRKGLAVQVDGEH